MLVLNDAPLWLRFRAVGGARLQTATIAPESRTRERVEKEFLTSSRTTTSTYVDARPCPARGAEG